MLKQILLMSALLAWAAPAARAADENAADDLPGCVTGFDQIVREFGGQAPFPFDRFVARASNPKTLEGGLPFTPQNMVLIPDGRSLQKDHADYAHPRVVLMTDAKRNRSQDVRNQVFLGYAPNARQIEVISWNACKRRWEFQLVQDYSAETRPFVRSPRRALCLDCHQNGGPLFASHDWNEVAGNIGGASLERYIRANGDSPTAYGTSLHNFNRIGHTIGLDVEVRRASELAQASRAGEALCRDDLDCRGQLLETALLSDEPSERLKRTLEKEWPAHGFAYPSSVLPDRDPSLDPEHGGTGFRKVIRPENHAGALRVLNSSRSKAHRGDPDEFGTPAYEVKRAILDHDGDFTYSERAAIGRISILPFNGIISDRPPDLVELIPFAATPESAANPRFPRPLIRAIPRAEILRFVRANALALVGLSEEDAAPLKKLEPAGLRKALATPQIRELLAQSWPPDRTRLVPALLRLMTEFTPAKKYEKSVQNQDAPPASEPSITADPSVRPKPPSLFRTYCATCHAGPRAIVELALDEPVKLRTTPVRKRLGEGSMPPKDAPQPTAAERRQMIDLLK